jgi:hypothetical protein
LGVKSGICESDQKGTSWDVLGLLQAKEMP